MLHSVFKTATCIAFSKISNKNNEGKLEEEYTKGYGIDHTRQVSPTTAREH
jgi:hypothetical protein